MTTKFANKNGVYVITDKQNVLPGITAQSKKVLEALMEDALMNYGR
jgi:hypothetical protein